MNKLLVIFAVVLPILFLFLSLDGKAFVSANDGDEVEDELETEVEGESEMELQSDGDGGQQDEGPELPFQSQDIDLSLLFAKPRQIKAQMEFPSQQEIELVIGFRNKGMDDYVVESVQASLRYPMDYNFVIQNFSRFYYNQQVPTDSEATIMYKFLAPEAYEGRPFGFVVDLAYRDINQNVVHQAVYNESVHLVEVEGGFNGETFFVYLFLIAGVVLLLVIGQQTLLTVGKKRVINRTKSSTVETGTNNPNNVDFDWLPKQTLNHIKKDKSPISTKHRSPKPRKAKRGTGSE